MMDFDTFLDATRATLFPGTLPTLNLPTKSHLHQGSCVFPDVILVSNYHSYKEKTIKLLPYMEVTSPQEKLSRLSWQSASKKIRSHQDLHLRLFFINNPFLTLAPKIV